MSQHNESLLQTARDQAWKVLVAEDDEALASLICRSLSEAGFVATSVHSGADAKAAIIEGDARCILLLDYQLPDTLGDELIIDIQKEGIEPHFIVTTGRGDEEVAVKMMKLGARDYLIKGTALIDSLIPTVERVARELDMEEELRQTQNRFYSAVTNAPSPMMIHADDGEVILINKVWSELSGYTADDIPTIADWTEKAYGMKMDVVKDDIDQLFELDSRKDWGEYKVRTAGGDEKIWFFSSAPLGELPDGRRIALSMAQDMTQQKQMQIREMDLQERLASAERRQSLGILAGGVAHDLNNILGPIVLLPETVADILRDGIDISSEDIEEARECLSIIENSAKRAAKVIKDLKALSRKGHIEMTPMDANTLVHDCLTTHEIQSLHDQYPGVKIGNNLHRERLNIAGDRTDLHRVLLNLIVNAVEAVVGQGRVLVETEPVSLAEEKIAYEAIPAGDYAVIHVRNTGDGIPDDLMKRIFEPFVTTKRNTGGRSGSGLGLSVVNSITKDHNAFIDIERDVGDWATTFSLYFPLATNGVEQTQQSEEDHVLPRGDEHVFIVDDEPNQRFVAKLGLKRLGYTVTEAISGREAMKIIKNAVSEREADGTDSGIPFDLVVLDMIMEDDFDGLDTYEAILKISPNQKVIIASGHVENRRAKAAEKLGAAWLPKPYQMHDLAGAVRKKLDQKL